MQRNKLQWQYACACTETLHTVNTEDTLKTEATSMAIRSTLLLLLLLSAFAFISALAVGEADDDVAALLAFKAAAIGSGDDDPLPSWNGSGVGGICGLEGVSCGRKHRRVVALTLPSYGLAGTLSPAIGNLSFLRALNLSSNWFHGSIPSSIGRLARLQRLDLSYNTLTGELPANLSSCASLLNLRIRSNHLHGRIPAELGHKLTSLKELSLPNNSFLTRTIAGSIANMSSLLLLDLSRNKLEGSIPPELGSMAGLMSLGLFCNEFSGVLPNSLYNLSLLKAFQVGWNMLSGTIPADIGDRFPAIEILHYSDNWFSGTIPPSVSNLSATLTWLLLDVNSFSGYVPPGLGRLQSLTHLCLDVNKLEADDRQGWEFITFLRNCSQLQYLENLEGPIPASLGNLKNLYVFDLSKNGLNGSIPREVLKLPALSYYLDLAYNSLSGSLPTEVGGLAYLSILLLSVALIWLIHKKLRKKHESQHTPTTEEQYEKISYHALSNGTNGFSEANLLGQGSYGAVYKCTLHDQDTIVAVKVFNIQQSRSTRSFVAECEALRRVRHRGLIKIITCCSSINHQGMEFKALVFEFMPNGSLNGWLHLESDMHTRTNTLSLEQRLHIAVDIMDALDYLHNYCQPPIIHCDIKPSNILLALDMSARVGDFGISRILPESVSKTLRNLNSTFGVKGSIGYVAPDSLQNLRTAADFCRPCCETEDLRGQCFTQRVDGGGSMRCAVLGGNLAQLAQKNRDLHR
ncbi:hypothetical protein SETIT_5G106700v2 [Setaria italica]|uniref:Protein kinase domain-containing protein n=1 Tax=Setaria italica TaxID=4555 RepID=A0A368R568_SETIT|nr:hypothetical protein SETIT_5G106700v2 [Setaria italica]